MFTAPPITHTPPPAKAILLVTPLGCTSKCVRMYALNDYIIQIHRELRRQTETKQKGNTARASERNSCGDFPADLHQYLL